VLTGFNWLSFLAKWQALLNTELNNWIPWKEQNIFKCWVNIRFLKQDLPLDVSY
jgi:hypothetical protein